VLWLQKHRQGAYLAQRLLSSTEQEHDWDWRQLICSCGHQVVCQLQHDANVASIVAGTCLHKRTKGPSKFHKMVRVLHSATVCRLGTGVGT
jgi:hypothetical protein